MMMQSHPEAWLRIDRVPKAGQPALFLDRDGTVIDNVPYLADPDRVSLIDGAVETLREFRARGYAIVIVTNQSGVARGLCSVAQYRAVEDRAQQVLADAAADLVYACPFHPDADGPFGIAHSSRKPEGGMLLDAARRFGIDLRGSIMVGDSLADVQAATASGIGRIIHVETGHGQAERAAVQAFAASAGIGLEYASSLARVRPVGEAAKC